MIGDVFSPAVVLSVLIASGYAFIFNFFWGGTFRQLARYWLIGLIGFGLGQLVAAIAGWTVLSIGDVHLLEGTLGCWLALLVAKVRKV